MKSLLLVAALLIGSIAHATCFPTNNLWIPTSGKMEAQKLSKKKFNEAIDKVYDYYAPVVKAKGFELVFNRAWDDGTVNSDTYVSGDKWIINSYGGLARYKGMDTVEAYAEVACHELGHHMGGAPIYSDEDWASVEGESDYWATKDCMKAIGFSDTEIAAASQVLANVLADLGGEAMPKPETPDKTVQTRTEEDHPVAQCRLDTYLMGLACPVQGDMDHVDPKVNSCFNYPTADSYDSGSRPRCWFAP